MDLIKRVRKSCVIMLIISCFFIPCVGYAAEITSTQMQAFASKKLARPTITSVKSVNSSSLKVSWKRCKYATKYDIYRSTSKTGRFAYIATTKKLYYIDKKTKKINTPYYYKVQAYNSKKTSPRSYAKSGKVIFNNGYIETNQDEYTISGGCNTYIPVYPKNCDTSILRVKQDDLFFLSVTDGKKHSILVMPDEDKWKPYDTEAYLTMRFDKYEDLYEKKIKLKILGYNNIPNYEKYHNTPDFGAFANKEPVIWSDSPYVYDFSEKYNGSDMYSAFEGYCNLLKKKGFKLFRTEDGFNETTKTYTKGFTAVVVIIKYSGIGSGSICIATD